MNNIQIHIVIESLTVDNESNFQKLKKLIIALLYNEISLQKY